MRSSTCSRLVQRVYGDFGLKPEMKLSTRPPEFLGAIEQWDHAESELKRALDAVGEPYTINEGDGAFYGPKIDFDVVDAIGRKWQCATIQLDYQTPAALRPQVHRRRQRRAPPGGDTSGDLRQLRALHCASDRALRRGLAALAGAGAGRSSADFGPASGLCCRGARPACPPPGSGST